MFLCMQIVFENLKLIACVLFVCEELHTDVVNCFIRPNRHSARTEVIVTIARRKSTGKSHQYTNFKRKNQNSVTLWLREIGLDSGCADRPMEQALWKNLRVSYVIKCINE